MNVPWLVLTSLLKQRPASYPVCAAGMTYLSAFSSTKHRRPKPTAGSRRCDVIFTQQSHIRHKRWQDLLFPAVIVVCSLCDLLLFSLAQRQRRGRQPRHCQLHEMCTALLIYKARIKDDPASTKALSNGHLDSIGTPLLIYESCNPVQAAFMVGSRTLQPRLLPAPQNTWMGAV